MIHTNKNTLLLPFLPLLVLIYWIWASLASRTLSCFHILNETGFYLSSLLLTGILVLIFKRTWKLNPSTFKIRYKRYLKGLPCLFAILLLLILIGFACSGFPKQGDFLEYRVPRMLHWLMNESIYFIPNWENRVNYSGTGQELALLPAMSMFKTDILVMPINFLMFATLPGIIFQTIRLLNVSGRISRILMWIIPASMSVLITQAGGSGNDLESTWFCSLTILLSLQFIRSTNIKILPLLACAGAIFCNIKTSNAIYLPFLILPLLFVFIRMRVKINWKILVLSFLLFVPLSVIPLMIQNYQHLGSVTGSSTRTELMPGKKLFSNAVGIMREGLQPPLLPASPHNRLSHELNHLPGIRQGLESIYGAPLPNIVGFSHLLMLETEENSGLGIAYTLLVLTFLTGILIGYLKKIKKSQTNHHMAWFYLISALGSILVISSIYDPITGVTRVQAPFFFTILLSIAPICSSYWTRFFVQKILSLIGVFILLNAWLITLLVPTHPAISLPLFVKSVEFFIPSMASKAMETYHKYDQRGKQFMELLPAGTEGPVTFVKSRSITHATAFWRVSNSQQYEWEETYPVWKNPEEAVNADILIITAETLRGLGYSSAQEFAKQHAYEILSSKQVYFYETPPLQIWALKKRIK